MKVLQVNCVYNKGSTGKIMYGIHTELQKNGISSVMCYGRGEKTQDAGVYKTCGELYSKFNNLLSRFTGIMYGGCFFSTNKLIGIIKKEKPDVVHLHCLNGYFVNIYRLISWLKKHNVKTVLTLHAEFMHTANCSHAFECEKWKTGCGKCPRLRQETKSFFLDSTRLSWKKMKKAFEGFGKNLKIVSVSPWLMGRAKQSPFFFENDHHVIFNGVDTNVFCLQQTEQLRQKYKPANEKIIFHATPYFTNDPEHIKGGHYVLRLAYLMQQENVKFLVAGDYDSTITVPKNVILLGKITDQKVLAQYYSAADVTLLTSKRETFSMICAESFCCGTPVVGFKAGAPEQIAIAKYSTFVEYGDVEGLMKEVKYFLDDPIEKAEISRAANDVYSNEKMSKEYLNLYFAHGME